MTPTNNTNSNTNSGGERRRSAPFHADSLVLRQARDHVHHPARTGGNLSSMPGLQHNAKKQLKNTRRQAPAKRTGPSTHKKFEDVVPALKDKTVRIIPLGGVEEVGKNMMAIEYKNDIIVIDAGIQFKTEETPGIDYILPNTKYLEERRGKIRALVITHGHLDHIGAIPYLIERLGNPPIYTREFGALLIKKRQTEFPHLPELNIKICGKDDGFIPLTPELKLKFFGLTHSIPDSTGVIINTPFGDIVNTGDVRVENHNGEVVPEEYEQYKFFKDRNVILLTMDSTGVEKPGWTISEDVVVKTIDKIVGEVPGRIIIATFASRWKELSNLSVLPKSTARN
jgi:mRNA degradation ribonuclease J1/J2